MINIDKDYLIAVDLKNTKVKSDKTIFFYNTDLNICNIFIKLICSDEDKTIPEDLIVEFAVLKPETDEFKPLDATLISKEDLLYQVDLTTDYFDIVGKYSCEIRVSGTIENELKCFTSEEFDYVVKPNITAKLNKKIKNDKNLPILEKLIKDVKDIGLGIEMNQVQLKKDDNLVGDNKSIVGAINQLREDVNSGGKVELKDYQKKTDDNLATEEKTIVGAVNEINSKTITLEKDDTSFNGIDDTIHNELNTTDKTIIGGINEVKSQIKDIANLSLTKHTDGKIYIKKQDGTLLGNGIEVGSDVDLSKITMSMTGQTLKLMNDGTQIATVEIPTAVVTDEQLTSIIQSKIDDGTLTSLTLGDNSVKTSNIQDKAITNNKLADELFDYMKVTELFDYTVPGTILSTSEQFTANKLFDKSQNKIDFTGWSTIENIKVWEGMRVYIPNGKINITAVGYWKNTDGNIIRNMNPNEVDSNGIFTVPVGENVGYMCANLQGTTNVLAMVSDGTIPNTKNQLLKANIMIDEKNVNKNKVLNDSILDNIYTEGGIHDNILEPLTIDNLYMNKMMIDNDGKIVSSGSYFGYLDDGVTPKYATAIFKRRIINGKITTNGAKTLGNTKLGGTAYSIICDKQLNMIGLAHKFIVDNLDTTKGYKAYWLELPDNSYWLLSTYIYALNTADGEVKIENYLPNNETIIAPGHQNVYWDDNYSPIMNNINNPYPTISVPYFDTYNPNRPYFQDKYYDKKIFTFGDSITSGSGGYTYSEQMAKVLGAYVKNYGSSGARADRMFNIISGNGYPVKDYSDVSAVTLMIGHNERQGTETLDSSGIKNIQNYTNYPNTFYGYICKSIEYIWEQNPNIRIYMCSLHHTTLEDGQRSELCYSALKEIAQWYSLPFIDLTYELGIGRHNLSTYSEDGVHLTKGDVGYTIMGNFIASQMLAK